MRGHFRQRTKGSWEIAINIGKDPATGRRKQHFETVKGNKGAAQKRMTELLRQLDTNSFIKPIKTTVKTYLEQWLQDYVKPNLSPRSYERYESVIRVHILPSLGNIPLTKLQPSHIQRLYSTKLNEGLASRSVLYIHRILHKALQTAIKTDLLSRNILDCVEVPKFKLIEMQIWDEDEVNRFLIAAKDSQYYTLFFTALFTGCRRSELLALKWSDINLLLCQLSISRGLHQLRNREYIFTQPKTAKSSRVISLSPSVVHVLKEYFNQKAMDKAMADIKLTDDDLVFSTFEGKPLRPNTVSRAWSITAKKAGIKIIRFHDARHTHASLMLKQGIHPKIVQERLGHSTISTTLDIYSHVTPGMQQAAAQRFDDILKVSYNERVIKSS